MIHDSSHSHMCFLSAPYEGRAQDKSMADLAGYTLPPGSSLYQDMGFQGFLLTGITMFQLQKKPRGGELGSSTLNRGAVQL